MSLWGSSAPVKPRESHIKRDKFWQDVLSSIDGELSEEEVEVPAKHYLSEFQVEKLSKYFSFWFDRDNNGVVTESDFGLLNEKIMSYTGWDNENRYSFILRELHQNFYNCLLEATDKNYHMKAHKIAQSIALDDWLNMWGRLTRGAMAMSNFPYWVQLLPKIMFAIIDQDSDGEISRDELKQFYLEFMEVDKSKIDRLCKRAFNSMTANGDYPLTCDLYEMVFANFLLGRTFAGPGQFIFGIFETSTQEQEVHIIQPQEDENPAWGRRKSHFMLHIKRNRSNNKLHTSDETANDPIAEHAEHAEHEHHGES